MSNWNENGGKNQFSRDVLSEVLLECSCEVRHNNTEALLSRQTVINGKENKSASKLCLLKEVPRVGEGALTPSTLLEY